MLGFLGKTPEKRLTLYSFQFFIFHCAMAFTTNLKEKILQTEQNIKY